MARKVQGCPYCGDVTLPEPDAAARETRVLSARRAAGLKGKARCGQSKRAKSAAPAKKH